MCVWARTSASGWARMRCGWLSSISHAVKLAASRGDSTGRVCADQMGGAVCVCMCFLRGGEPRVPRPRAGCATIARTVGELVMGLLRAREVDELVLAAVGGMCVASSALSLPSVSVSGGLVGRMKGWHEMCCVLSIRSQSSQERCV